MADEIARTFEDVMAGFEQTTGAIDPSGGSVTPPVPPSGMETADQDGADIPHPAQVAAVPAQGDKSHPAAPTSVPPPDPMAAKRAGEQQIEQSIQQAAVSSGAMATPPPPSPQPAMPQSVTPSAPGGMGIQQMQATQQHITSGQMQSAPQMAVASGQGQTMLPDPSMLTTPEMGVFRSPRISQNKATMPFGVTGQPPPQGLVPGFGDRIRPPLQFERPFDSAIARAEERSALAGQRYSAFAQAGGRTIASTFGGVAGGAIGGMIGGAIGGPAAALRFGDIGMMAGGLAGSMMPGVGEATASVFRPSIERRFDTIRMREASQNFFVGGPTGETDITGTGLSSEAAEGLTRDFDRIAAGSGRNINRQDVTSIAQMASETGLLDLEGNTEEVAEAVKNITNLVGTFARVTGTADFRQNIRRIAQMRQMGMPLEEMDEAARNMDMYSRQAGMNPGQMMETAGMQGATAFQRAGLVAGQGIESGAFGRAFAQTGANAGAFSAQELGLYGGVSGVGQMVAESQAAFTRGPISQMLPALVNQGEDGFEVDQQAIQALQSGDMSFREAIQQGQTQAQEMGRGNFANMLLQQNELSSLVQQEMGPQGTNMAMMQMIQGLSEQYGVGTRVASNMVFQDRQRANAFANMMNDPETMQRMQRMQRFERRRQQFANQQSVASPMSDRELEEMYPEEGWFTDFLQEDIQEERLRAVGGAQRVMDRGIPELTERERGMVDMRDLSINVSRPNYSMYDVMTGARGEIRQATGMSNPVRDLALTFGGMETGQMKAEVEEARQLAEATLQAGEGDVGGLREAFGSRAMDVHRAMRQEIEAQMGYRGRNLTPVRNTPGGQEAQGGPMSGQGLMSGFDPLLMLGYETGMTGIDIEQAVANVSAETGIPSGNIQRNLGAAFAGQTGEVARAIQNQVGPGTLAELTLERSGLTSREGEMQLRGITGQDPSDMSPAVERSLDLMTRFEGNQSQALLYRAIQRGPAGLSRRVEEQLREAGQYEQMVAEAREAEDLEIGTMRRDVGAGLLRATLGETLAGGGSGEILRGQRANIAQSIGMNVGDLPRDVSAMVNPAVNAQSPMERFMQASQQGRIGQAKETLTSAASRISKAFHGTDAFQEIVGQGRFSIRGATGNIVEMAEEKAKSGAAGPGSDFFQGVAKLTGGSLSSEELFNAAKTMPSGKFRSLVSKSMTTDKLTSDTLQAFDFETDGEAGGGQTASGFFAAGGFGEGVDGEGDTQIQANRVILNTNEVKTKGNNRSQHTGLNSPGV